jgi:hypothetical protein
MLQVELLCRVLVEVAVSRVTDSRKMPKYTMPHPNTGRDTQRRCAFPSARIADQTPQRTRRPSGLDAPAERLYRMVVGAYWFGSSAVR